MYIHDNHRGLPPNLHVKAPGPMTKGNLKTLETDLGPLAFINRERGWPMPPAAPQMVTFLSGRAAELIDLKAPETFLQC